MSGKAVEAAGDVQTLILDKTGTITTGNREANDSLRFMASAEGPHSGRVSASYSIRRRRAVPSYRAVRREALNRCLVLTRRRDWNFSAQTRNERIDLVDGRVIRKGAVNRSFTRRPMSSMRRCSGPSGDR